MQTHMCCACRITYRNAKDLDLYFAHTRRLQTGQHGSMIFPCLVQHAAELLLSWACFMHDIVQYAFYLFASSLFHCTIIHVCWCVQSAQFEIRLREDFFACFLVCSHKLILMCSNDFGSIHAHGGMDHESARPEHHEKNVWCTRSDFWGSFSIFQTVKVVKRSLVEMLTLCPRSWRCGMALN